MGELAALLSAMVWAATSVMFTSLTSRTQPIVLSALRLTVGSAALALILLASGQFHSYSDATTLGILGVMGSGVVGYAFGDTLYIRVLGLLGLQRAFPISMALYISMTVVGGIVILGEPFKWGLPLGALLIGAGIVLIVVPGAREPDQPLTVVPPAEPALSVFEDLTHSGPADPHPMLGYALLLLVGVCWATATLWLAGARGRLEPVAASAIRAPAGGLSLLAFALVTRPAAVRASFARRRTILGILAAGLVGTGFGSLMYVYAVSEAGAARTAVLSATAPLMGLPLSLIFLRERFTRRVAVGTLICVAGILAVIV
jgi:drug/metabolite transporter, DME family